MQPPSGVTAAMLYCAEMRRLALVLIAALAFAACGDDAGTDAGTDEGAAVYTDNCADCHGSDGSGGVGPALSDGAVVENYPDIADEIDVISDGQGGMPAFGDRLSAEEIEQVAAYTRDGL
jgi:mono/diheme cytochrome c family protein